MKKTALFLLAASMALTAQARAPGERTAWQAVTCDHACLSQWTRDYVAALAKRAAQSPRRIEQHNRIAPSSGVERWIDDLDESRLASTGNGRSARAFDTRIEHVKGEEPPLTGDRRVAFHQKRRQLKQRKEPDDYDG